MIKRESVSRYVDITANVSGRDVVSTEDDIKGALKQMAFPTEYHAEVVTDKATGFRTTRSSILPFLIAAAIGILLLLQAIFGSWRLAFLSFVALPAALAGGVRGDGDTAPACRSALFSVSWPCLNLAFATASRSSTATRRSKKPVPAPTVSRSRPKAPTTTR